MIIELLKKYREMLLYLFFGGCTTLINLIIYFIGRRIIKFDVITSTVFAWIIAVAFAYVTNRIWVFKSKNSSLKNILREISDFVSCRLFSGLLDLLIMWIFVDILLLNDMVIKILSNIVVVIINYVASKWFIFREK